MMKSGIIPLLFFLVIIFGSSSFCNEVSEFSMVMSNENVRLLFQQGKYMEAEKVYAATQNPDAFWLALLKMKQGNKAEGIDLLEGEIAKSTPDGQKISVIRKSAYIIADASPELLVGFLGQYEKIIGGDLDMICLRTRYLMNCGKFDEALLLINRLLDNSNNASGGNRVSNLENTLYTFISELYAHRKAKEALSFFDILSEKYPEIRLNAGMQLLWSRIAVQENRGLEALKKIDWVMERFPDYCEKHQNLVLFSKAVAYESIGDMHEVKKIVLQLDEIVKKNPGKYAGGAMFVQDKLREFQQRDAHIELQKKVAEEAERNPYGTPVGEQFITKARWSTRRLLLIGSGIVLIILSLLLIRISKSGK
jgi:tetratricopeptide (TPR) repeat protein